MRFPQRLVDPGHVADTEGDRIGVELARGIAQLFRILARPGQAGDAAFHRAFDPNVEHVLIDIGHGHFRAAFRHAEGDVARAPRHVEHRFAVLGLHPLDETVLPQPVHAPRHRIVHDVVFAGDIRKDRADAGGLFVRGDILVSEGDGVVVGRGLIHDAKP